MRKNILFVWFCSVLAASLFTGCKKNDVEEPKPALEYDTQTSQDNSLAESTFNDVDNIGNQAIENTSNNADTLTSYRLTPGNMETSILSTCATITVTRDTSGGGSLSINFGTSNCLCKDLRFRRGTINIAFTGAYRDSGSQITTTFTNYWVGRAENNMFNVTGTKTVTNKGHNSAGHEVFQIQVNGQLKNSANSVMSWESTREREWIAGESTTGLLGWLDDEYYITGSASGTNFEGTSFTARITQPLHVALSCWWIKDGKFELTPSGKVTRYFDYGDGTCDDLVKVTVNGVDYEYHMR